LEHPNLYESRLIIFDAAKMEVLATFTLAL